MRHGSGAGNLPGVLTPLIGRQPEIARIEAILQQPDTRLVTLTGPGGVGKTRLAVEVARRHAAALENTVHWVSLSGVTTAAAVAPAIAASLGIAPTDDGSPTAALLTELAHQDALVIIDNFEQVIGAAHVLSEILQAGSTLRFLVTSRSLLNVSGEHRVPIAPLAAPGLDDRLSPLALQQFAAVQLFVAQAQASEGAFTVNAGNADDVRRICARLDGLPLALVLAASRLRHLSTTSILQRLEDRFALLVGGPSDQPDRLRTLHEAIKWSYDLLSAEDQRLFRHLAVLPDGWTLDAAEQVLGRPEIGADVIDGLSRLVDVSLLQRSSLPGHELRFFMLESIREFGCLQFARAGGDDAVMQRIASYLLDLAAAAQSAFGGPGQRLWIERLDAERNNLAFISEWALQAGQPAMAIDLGIALWFYWVRRGYLADGRDLLRRAIAASELARERPDADALFNLANLEFELRDFAEAQGHYETCLAEWQRLDDQDGIACAWNGLGLIAREVGAFRDAEHYFTAALAAWTQLANQSGVAFSQYNLGRLAAATGDYQKALTHLAHALDIRQAIGEVDGSAFTEWAIASAQFLSGNLADAKRNFQKSLATFTETGNQRGESSALVGLARLAQVSGNHLEALRLFHRTLTFRHQITDHDGVIECIEGIAASCAVRGSPLLAAQLLAATDAFREKTRAIPTDAERRHIEAVARDLQQTLTETDSAEAAWVGQRMSLRDATARALEFTHETTETPPGEQTSIFSGFSPREDEVFQLLLQHLTDREIAARLFLSSRTVERHVGSILAKLNVPNRRAAIALGSSRPAS